MKGCGERKNSTHEASVSFELSFAYEHGLAGVKARNFSLSFRSGNDICDK